MEWHLAKAEILKGWEAHREPWPCKIIRASKESDLDHFLHEINLEGVIIEYCPRKECDCEIGVWVPELGDKEAADWITNKPK